MLGITFYEASRHSFCTQIVEGGATEFEAQILMHHTDPRSTRDYIHANVVKFRDIVNRRGKKPTPIRDGMRHGGGVKKRVL